MSVADTAELWGCQIPSTSTISVHKDQELLCLTKSSLCPQSNLPGVRQAQVAGNECPLLPISLPVSAGVGI